jgi:hypothetical protein
VAVSIDDVRALALTLPRSTEGVVRGKVRFYVGRIVYVAMEREGIMGFAHPREWREAAVEAEPDKFVMPTGVDFKYKWLYVRTDAIDVAEMRELVTDAWSMVVPRKVLDAYLASRAEEPLR